MGIHLPSKRGIVLNEYINLSWLPLYTGNFAEDCALVREGNVDTLKALMRYKLSDTQLNRIARIKRECPALAEEFEPFSIAIIGDANSDFVKAAMEASALRHGLWLDVHTESLGNVVGAVLDTNSELYNSKPNAVLLAYTSHSLPNSSIGNEEQACQRVGELISDIELIKSTIKSNVDAQLLVQTIPTTPTSLFGSIDRRVVGTAAEQIAAFNSYLYKSSNIIVDVAGLADSIGLSNWHDMNYWHWAKIPFANQYIPLYADYCARHIAALRGKSKKGLVLDLDNTLWAGIIGDDGVENIELGHGSAKGEAHLAIQKMAADLKERGVVLAVCSKNDECNAHLPFKEHPETILKLDDFAAFQANWHDKASNIQAIADALTLTPDALVFLDDNPAEREIVRQELPQVAVPEIPDDNPAAWPMILSAAGYFEAIQFTENDKQRAEQYTANAKRNELKSKVRDLGSYLESLEMTLTMTSCSKAHRARAAQLINRSNQYNLTTRRYTDEQLAKMEKDPSVFCFAAKLEDKFGDNGIISIVICREDGDDWYIDTWLTSCRVLGRNVEFNLLNYIAEMASANGKKALVGHYIPSKKNQMTEAHYEKIGFAHLSEDGEGTRWQLQLGSFEPHRSYMKVEDKYNNE